MKVARRILLGDPGRLKLIPPEPEAGRHGLALVLIAKDESRHLKDWLTFHALAGVRTAFIYDNGSKDDTVEIARNFKGMEVHVIPWVVDVSLGPMPLPASYVKLRFRRPKARAARVAMLTIHCPLSRLISFRA